MSNEVDDAAEREDLTARVNPTVGGPPPWIPVPEWACLDTRPGRSALLMDAWGTCRYRSSLVPPLTCVGKQ